MLGATRLGMECLLTLTLSLTLTHSNAKHSVLTLRMVAPIPIVSVNAPDFSAWDCGNGKEWGRARQGRDILFFFNSARVHHPCTPTGQL